MRAFRSTTFRFAALVFLLQLATAAVLIVTIGVVLRDQLTADATRTVAMLRDDLRAAYDAGGVTALAGEVSLRTGRLVTPGTVLLLLDRDGRRRAGNLDAWPPSVQIGHPAANVTLYRSAQAVPELMHVAASRLPGGECLLVGTVVAGEARALRLLEQASEVALLLGLIFAALAAWTAAQMIVARLHDPLAALAAVSEGDLAARVPPDVAGDAFATLGRSINGALERVERLVAELRIATDGLAHDLKSPLTRMRAALERAGATVREPAAQDSIDRAMAEADRLLVLVQTALSITRAEAGIGRESFSNLDLVEELANIADMYAPLVEDAGRTLTVVGPETMTAGVHRELVAQAIGNLLDNSLKYGAGPIVIRVHRCDKLVHLSVGDRGPGIAPDRRDEALRRFGRLDSARSGTGAGLGLSLAAAVAHLHDGNLTLEDAEPGLIVTLRLSLR